MPYVLCTVNVRACQQKRSAVTSKRGTNLQYALWCFRSTQITLIRVSCLQWLLPCDTENRQHWESQEDVFKFLQINAFTRGRRRGTQHNHHLIRSGTDSINKIDFQAKYISLNLCVTWVCLHSNASQQQLAFMPFCLGHSVVLKTSLVTTS